MFHKKIVNLISIVLITGVLVAAALYMDEAVSFNRLCISDEKYETIKNSRDVSTQSLVTNIYFDDNALISDGSKFLYFYSLIENSNTSYNPKIRIDGISDNLKIAIKSAEISKDLISSNEHINIIVYSDSSYCEYQIVCTTLPIIQMDYDENATINAYSDTLVNFTLFDNSKDIEERIVNSLSFVHTRGMTSSNYPKKNYKISLKTEIVSDDGQETSYVNNKVSLLGIRKDDDWILYSPYNDCEKIRNIFCSNLWYETCASNNRFNIIAGCQYRYVEVIINGEYAGIYGLGYQPDEKQMDLSENDLGQNTEYLFKKKSWTQSEIYAKYSWMSGYTGYELKSDNQDGNAWGQLNSYYRTLQNTKDISVIYEIADIDNMIDFRLFTYFAVAVDNVSEDAMKNMFVVLKKNDSGYTAMYVPWDLDISFGTRWVYSGNNSSPYSAGIDYYVGSYMNPIDYLYNLGDTSVYEKLIERYSYLRQNEWSEENLNVMIDKYEEYIYDSGAYLRELERWPNGTYIDSSLKLSKFRQYVMDRLEYMDSYIYSTYSK